MKTINLTKGQVTLVDDADFDWLSKWKWYAEKGKPTFYAVRRKTISVSKSKLVKMHREILGLKHGDKREGEHRDHDGLNNQRSNLRICTRGQNMGNTRGHKNSTSKYVGVYWDRKRNKWKATICLKGKGEYLGSFDSEIEAAKYRNERAKKYFGDFAHINII